MNIAMGLFSKLRSRM